MGSRAGRVRGLWAREPIRRVSLANASALWCLRLLGCLRSRSRNRVWTDRFVGQTAIQADLFQGSEPPQATDIHEERTVKICSTSRRTLSGARKVSSPRVDRTGTLRAACPIAIAETSWRV